MATLKYSSDWKAISKIADVCVDNLGYVYIVDSGTNRIIGLDQDYNLRLVIDSFVNDMGVPDSLSEPSGCFVTDTEILVADTNKARIVIFDKVGNFKEIVPETQLRCYSRRQRLQTDFRRNRFIRSYLRCFKNH